MDYDHRLATTATSIHSPGANCTAAEADNASFWFHNEHMTDTTDINAAWDTNARKVPVINSFIDKQMPFRVPAFYRR